MGGWQRGLRNTLWGRVDTFSDPGGADQRTAMRIFLGLSQPQDSRGEIGHRSLMRHDHPSIARLTQYDQIHSHIVPARVRRLVAGNRVPEVAGTLRSQQLDRIDSISGVDTLLHVGLDVRPSMNDAGRKCWIR